MRAIDADALVKVIVNERDRIQNAYGMNDEYARCLNKYALTMVENAPTIAAIQVEWLDDRANDITRAPLYRRYAQMLMDEWQKEQEATPWLSSAK